MAKNPEAVEDPPDGQLPRDVVGVVEHHIGMMEVPMSNLRENSTEPKGVHKGTIKERRETKKGDGGPLRACDGRRGRND